MPVIVFKPTIKFFTLIFGKLEGLWHGRHAVPNIFHELYAFGNAELQDIGQGDFTHELGLAETRRKTRLPDRGAERICLNLR